jgi:hypothetical protein
MREYLPTLTLPSPSPRERESCQGEGAYDSSSVFMSNPG